MVEQTPPSNSRNMHAIILGVLGIIIVLVGTYIITVHGALYEAQVQALS
jgi:hypothetical protein